MWFSEGLNLFSINTPVAIKLPLVKSPMIGLHPHPENRPVVFSGWSITQGVIHLIRKKTSRRAWGDGPSCSSQASLCCMADVKRTSVASVGSHNEELPRCTRASPDSYFYVLDCRSLTAKTHLCALLSSRGPHIASRVDYVVDTTRCVSGRPSNWNNWPRPVGRGICCHDLGTCG